MKNFLLVILLMTSAVCGAQKSSPQAGPDSLIEADTALSNFIAATIQYPENAVAAGIEGTVYVTFVVNANGTIDNVSLLRDIGGGCGEEAVRVVKLIPKWKPSNQTGAVKYYLPVKFRISWPEGPTGTIAIYD
jgi:TonB family protein